ncbi:LOW QUALITY PROTEIN: hypothetical protein NC652_010201 [Populus alba x Populus x berolinensis]|nr:LOW QUALITY PROTEIN: hypothetical protein NC652_010201 [Populus alba x Populus x berolinensis]
MSYPISRTSYNNDVGCGGSGEKSGAAINLISKKMEENRVVSTTFTITNKCNYTVWPGIFSNPGSAALSTTGFSLEKNESKTLTAPDSWRGRFWGRTYCTEDSSGNFSCISGDCGSGKLECSGNGGAPPVTLAEFGIGSFGGVDFFDVSLVDGFNLPLLVVPSRQNCTSSECVVDLNESCPSELKFPTSTEGKTVGCMSACQVTGLSMFCCNGTAACKASLYSQFFKNACPQAYSYATDDVSSTFTCASTDYQVTFCPGNTTVITKNNSRPSPGEIAPIPPPEIRPDTTSRRHWVPIIAGIVGGVLAIISFVVIIVWRVRLSKSNDTEEDVEDDYLWNCSTGICARRSVDHSQPESAFHLLRMLQNKAEYILEFLDEYMQSDRDEMIRMIKIAAWCLQDDPEKRPLMSTVVKVLEGVMDVDSNLVYKFSHALAPPPVADDYILSAPPPASVLSNPR